MSLTEEEERYGIPDDDPSNPDHTFPHDPESVLDFLYTMRELWDLVAPPAAGGKRPWVSSDTRNTVRRLVEEGPQSFEEYMALLTDEADTLELLDRPFDLHPRYQTEFFEALPRLSVEDSKNILRKWLSTAGAYPQDFRLAHRFMRALLASSLRDEDQRSEVMRRTDSLGLGMSDRLRQGRLIEIGPPSDQELVARFESGNLSEYERRCLIYSGGFSRWEAQGNDLSDIVGHELVKPFEGVSWILDLLPEAPRRAHEALSHYTHVHLLLLPDNRGSGLLDSLQLIRQRFMITPGNLDLKAVFSGLTPYEFELLVSSYYDSLGFSCRLTSSSADGGVDILAVSESRHSVQTIAIQCKLQSSPVTVGQVRDLVGASRKYAHTQLVLATNSSFTKRGPYSAKSYSAGEADLQLLDGQALADGLTEEFGESWPNRIDRLIQRMMLSAKDRARTDTILSNRPL